MSATRSLLGDLVAARAARSTERVAALLDDGVRYWDPEHGALAGRRRVAEALTASAGRLELETLAAAGGDAVLELQLSADGRRHRSTEVYRAENGAVVDIKAYFDPVRHGG